MLIGAPFRARALFYAAALSLILLIAKVLYSTPGRSSWQPSSPGPVMGEVLGNQAFDFEKANTPPDSLIHEESPGSWEGSPNSNLDLESSQQNAAAGSQDQDDFEPTTQEDSSEKSDDSESNSNSDSGTDQSGGALYEENSQKPGLDPEADRDLPCRNLPGAEDVVVIMRTGATEINDKLPAHFGTTFRCYSDLLIFSDYEETFMGEQVHDVLRNVNTRLKEDIKDFAVYNRVQAGGKAALKPHELSGKLSFEGGKSGKPDSPGWRLDKWKFLPMMRETLTLRPDKKWYVFVESDSYVVWSNLLKYLAQLNPENDIYYGSEVQIGEDLFAHGGSAFLMSKSAIEKAADQYESNVDDYHDLTDAHWAGDCILGIVLLDAGVRLGWAWPMFQGGHPEKMDYAEEKADVQIWCSPILSFHHFNDEELHRVWQMEQDWITAVAERPARKQGEAESNKEEGRGDEDSRGHESQDDSHSNDDNIQKRWSIFSDNKKRVEGVLYGSDVFKNFVQPNFTDFRGEWNALSPELVADSAGLAARECQQLCREDGGCRQWTQTNDGCYKGQYAMLGQPWGDVRSGWMLDRIDEWASDLDVCSTFKQGWTLV